MFRRETKTEIHIICSSHSQLSADDTQHLSLKHLNQNNYIFFDSRQFPLENVHCTGFYNETTRKRGKLKMGVTLQPTTLELAISSSNLRKKWQMKIYIHRKQFKNFWNLTSRKERSTEGFKFTLTMPNVQNEIMEINEKIAALPTVHFLMFEKKTLMLYFYPWVKQLSRTLWSCSVLLRKELSSGRKQIWYSDLKTYTQIRMYTHSTMPKQLNAQQRRTWWT